MMARSGCSMQHRFLSSSIPRHGSWASLNDSQRAAWTVLGWNADKWDNHGSSMPQSSFKVWSKLSAEEKAAAKYGLGYAQEEWNTLISKSGNSEIDRFNMAVRKDKGEIVGRTPPPKSVPVDASLFGTPSKGSNDSNQSVTSRLAQAAWNVAKTVAPSATNTLSEKMAPPVVVNGIETTVYLDDSPSMNETTGGWFSFTSPTRLEQGRKVLSSLAPKLGSGTRVLKFSNKPTVLSMREEKGGTDITSCLPQITSGWDGSGNGTYLWKMIEEDVMERYRPGTGKLRLVVVTDGEDNLSPWNYQGMAGMDPMMRKLQQSGYDIEWHIIVIGGESGLERYKALAGATGGTFLTIENDFDEKSRDVASFLKAIESSTDEHGRRERQQRYERDRDTGKVDKVDWYKKLPPPDKK